MKNGQGGQQRQEKNNGRETSGGGRGSLAVGGDAAGVWR